MNNAAFDSSVYSGGFPFFVKIEEELKQTGVTPKGIPQFETEEIIHLIQGATVHPVRVQEYRVRHPVEWSRYVEPIYLQWKATKDKAVDGAPLDRLPFIQKVQVLQLAAVQITSIEQLLAAEDALLELVQDGAKLKTEVKAFMEGGKQSKKLLEQRKKIEQLENKISYLETRLASMIGENEKEK